MITGSADVAEIFVELADTLVDEFGLVEFLQMLANRATSLSDTHSAAVLLGDQNGRLQFMAASDEQIHNLEVFQLSVYEGPCVDCFRFGAPIINADLSRSRSRWPRFAAQATTLGLHSVHAFPLRLRGQVLGSMGLFSERAVPIPPGVVRILQAIADVATIGILQERMLRRSEIVSGQLQNALNSRVLVEQAKGHIAQQYQVSIDEAFELLRAYCRRHNLLLRETAQLIIDGRGQAPDLRAH